MHSLHARLVKYISVAAFRIYAYSDDNAAKRRRWRPYMEITLKIMEKSWNCVFRFLWAVECHILNLPFLGHCDLDF